MRIVRKILGILVLVVLGLLLFLRFFGGATIKQAVNTGGPAILGVPVSLQSAKLDPISGYLHLDRLHVGNPEGFKTDGIFNLGQLEISLDTRSLLSDTIHIRKIDIKDPEITMERGLTQSNLGALLEKLEKKEDGAAEEEKPAQKPAAEGGKKVVIDEINIVGAQLNLSVTAMGGLSAPLPLPPLTLRDLGKEKEGASFTEVISEVLKAVIGSATQVAAGAGKLVGEGAKAVGEGAMVVGGAAVDGAAAVGGAAVSGAEAVGGAAVGGAKAVGGAVLDGAGSVVKGIGGLLGGGEKKETNAAEKSAE